MSKKLTNNKHLSEIHITLLKIYELLLEEVLIANGKIEAVTKLREKWKKKYASPDRP